MITVNLTRMSKALIVVATGLLSDALAAQIANPSFEAGADAGWSTAGSVSGVISSFPTSEFTAARAPDGSQSAYFDGTIAQQTSARFVEGTHTIIVYIGKRNDGSSAPVTLELWVGGTVSGGGVSGGEKLASKDVVTADWYSGNDHDNWGSGTFYRLEASYDVFAYDDFLTLYPNELLSIRVVKGAGTQMDVDHVTYRYRLPPEPFPAGEYSTAIDVDGNGLSDVYEVLHGLNDPSRADGLNGELSRFRYLRVGDDGIDLNSDSPGESWPHVFTDWQEDLAGTDPNSAASFLELKVAENTYWEYWWDGVQGKHYLLMEYHKEGGDDYFIAYRQGGVAKADAIEDDFQEKYLIAFDWDSDGDGLNDWEEKQLNPSSGALDDTLKEKGWSIDLDGNLVAGSWNIAMEFHAGLSATDPYDLLSDYDLDGSSNGAEIFWRWHRGKSDGVYGYPQATPADVQITTKHDPNLIFWVRSDLVSVIKSEGSRIEPGTISHDHETGDIYTWADISGHMNHARHIEGTWNESLGWGNFDEVTGQYQYTGQWEVTDNTRFPRVAWTTVSGVDVPVVRFDASLGETDGSGNPVRSADAGQYFTALGVEPGPEYTVSYVFKSGSQAVGGVYRGQNTIGGLSGWDGFRVNFEYGSASHWHVRVGGQEDGSGYSGALRDYSVVPKEVFSLITFVRTQTGITFYLDGQLVPQWDGPDQVTEYPLAVAAGQWGGLIIGDWQDNPVSVNEERNLDGDLLEVRVYKKALSEDEVRLLAGEVWRQYGTDVLSKDGDSVPDFIESLNPGASFSDLDGDPDGDGLTTAVELELGTDPFSASAAPVDRFAGRHDRMAEQNAPGSLSVAVPGQGLHYVSTESKGLTLSP